jgi:predicted phosphodiesterase
MNDKNIKAELVDKALKDFPDKPTTTLAKMLYNNHPKVFDRLDNVRAMIRYRRGNKGADCREKAKKNHGKTFRTNGAAGWSIPKSDKKINKPYKLVPGKWLILSDIHVPYHDEEALEIALKYGEDQGIEHIYLNGDTCDFYNVSSYQKNPEERDLANELTKTRQLLGHLRQRFPKAKIVFKIGNHEDRWEKYLYLKAPELIGVANFELYYVLDFAKYGIELVKSTQKAKAGKHLTILHGHEVRNTGVYPARTLMLRTHVCSIAGHNHRTSTYTEKTSDNKFLVSFTSGCLSELEPDYMPINQWNLGFIILDFDGNDFTVNNLRILNGQVK